MALFSHFNIGNYIIGEDNSQVKPMESFNVLNYQTVTSCANDGFQPTTMPKVEYVEIVVKCDTTPLPLYRWYRNNNIVNGCIVVDIPDGGHVLGRQIVMEGAQCFFFNEKYNIDKPQHQVTLRISVEKLSVDNNIYKRR